METQTTIPTKAVTARLTATLATISQDVGDIPMQIFNDVEQQQCEQSGAMVFVYRGVDGQPDKQIDVEISLPIQFGTSGNDYNGKFEVNDVAPFNYVENLYVGPVADMSKKGYEPLFAQLAQTGLVPNGECREVYEHWVGPDSAENRINIQVGVQQR